MFTLVGFLARVIAFVLDESQLFVESPIAIATLVQSLVLGQVHQLMCFQILASKEDFPASLALECLFWHKGVCVLLLNVILQALLPYQFSAFRTRHGDFLQTEMQRINVALELFLVGKQHRWIAVITGEFGR